MFKISQSPESHSGSKIERRASSKWHRPDFPKFGWAVNFWCQISYSISKWGWQLIFECFRVVENWGQIFTFCLARCKN